MGQATYLQIPGVKSLRKRAASLPTEHDRYVAIGERHRRGLFGSVSPRSRASRVSPVSNNTGSVDWESMSMSPHRSEDPSTPRTPQTPPSGSRQTKQTPFITPPPISRYSRSGYGFYSNPESSDRRPREKVLLCELEDIVPFNQPRQIKPVELAGSLLLPSQGFPQSNPPEIPPRSHKRRQRNQSAPVAVSPSSLSAQVSSTVNATTSPVLQDSHASSSLYAWSPEELSMAKRSRQRDNSRWAFNQEQDASVSLPVRTSSLRSTATISQLPVPLSKMSMEELMQILPMLDAAIIAHDWVPCMQKRHQELKELLHQFQRSPAPDVSFKLLDTELGKLFSQSQNIAQDYHTLFQEAKRLQEAELQRNAAGVDQAKCRESEAKLALARLVVKHEEVCESYERALLEHRNSTRQSVQILNVFIHQYLGNAAVHAPQQQIQQVFEILTANEEERNLPVRHVSSELYHDSQKALKKVTEEKRRIQEICDEQMTTIREQSQELDQHVARIVNTARKLQDKDRDNETLTEENNHLRLMIAALENAARVDKQSKLDHELYEKSVSRSQVKGGSTGDDMWAKDAEIMNLRIKLEQTCVREKDLQTQIRALLQSSQTETATARPNRFKRLLTGGSRGSPTLPVLNSMQNLSESILTPLEKGKLHLDVPPSPTASSKTSPSLANICGPTPSDFELPPPHKGHIRSHSSADLGPRLRPGIQFPQDCEIDSAISSRFYQMPSNLRSTTSITRPQTSKSTSDTSVNDPPKYGRSLFDSAPEVPDFHPGSFRQDDIEHDRQPLIPRRRELSGITEVTEDAGSVKRKSSSPDSSDKRMYLDSIHALGRLQIHY